MPDYTLQFPNGSEYTISSPKDLTEDELTSISEGISAGKIKADENLAAPKGKYYGSQDMEKQAPVTPGSIPIPGAGGNVFNFALQQAERARKNMPKTNNVKPPVNPELQKHVADSLNKIQNPLGDILRPATEQELKTALKELHKIKLQRGTFKDPELAGIEWQMVGPGYVAHVNGLGGFKAPNRNLLMQKIKARINQYYDDLETKKNSPTAQSSIEYDALGLQHKRYNQIKKDYDMARPMTDKRRYELLQKDIESVNTGITDFLKKLQWLRPDKWAMALRDEFGMPVSDFERGLLDLPANIAGPLIGGVITAPAYVGGKLEVLASDEYTTPEKFETVAGLLAMAATTSLTPFGPSLIDDAFKLAAKGKGPGFIKALDALESKAGREARQEVEKFVAENPGFSYKGLGKDNKPILGYKAPTAEEVAKNAATNLERNLKNTAAVKGTAARKEIETFLGKNPNYSYHGLDQKGKPIFKNKSTGKVVTPKSAEIGDAGDVPDVNPQSAQDLDQNRKLIEIAKAQDVAPFLKLSRAEKALDDLYNTGASSDLIVAKLDEIEGLRTQVAGKKLGPTDRLMSPEELESTYGKLVDDLDTGTVIVPERKPPVKQPQPKLEETKPPVEPGDVQNPDIVRGKLVYKPNGSTYLIESDKDVVKRDLYKNLSGDDLNDVAKKLGVEDFDENQALSLDLLLGEAGNKGFGSIQFRNKLGKTETHFTGVTKDREVFEAAKYENAVPVSERKIISQKDYEDASRAIDFGIIDPESKLRELAKLGKKASDLDVQGIAAQRGKYRRQLETLRQDLSKNTSNSTLREEYNGLLKTVEEFDGHLDEVLTASGRGLKQFKVGNDVADLTPAQFIEEAKRRHGKDVIVPEKQLQNIQKKIDNAKAKLTSEVGITDVEMTPVAKSTRSIEDIRADRQQILKDLASITNKASANPVFEIAQGMKLLGKLVYNYAEEGVKTIEELIKRVKSTPGFEDVTDEQIIRAAAGEFTKKAVKSTPKSTVAEEARLMLKKQDIENQLSTGNFALPKTKAERIVADNIKNVKDEIALLEQEKKLLMSAVKPKTVGERATNFGRAMQLANISSRVMDLLANEAKYIQNMVILNPARSAVSLLAKDTSGRELLGSPLWSPKRYYDVVWKGKATRWAKEAKTTLKGLDEEIIKKYGAQKGTSFFDKTLASITNFSGITDITFKDTYYRLALDDYATAEAKKLGKAGMKENRAKMFKQLTEGVDGPLRADQVTEAITTAKDWALRQTFNNDNLIATMTENGKNGLRREIRKSYPGKGGEEVSDAVVGIMDIFSRFTKVITNVQLEKLGQTPIDILGVNVTPALPEAAVRLAMAKRAALAISKDTKIPAKDVRLIADLFSKGLYGLGAFYAGQYMAENGYLDSIGFKGEIEETAAGFKFMSWSMEPGDDKRFAIDLDTIGGPLAPLLMGATKQKLEKMVANDDISATEAKSLYNRYFASSTVSTPLGGNLQAGLTVLQGDGNIPKYLGGVIARQVVPGQLNDIARRKDQGRKRKTETIWDQFIQRLPGERFGIPGLYTIPGRESLPLNEPDN